MRMDRSECGRATSGAAHAIGVGAYLPISSKDGLGTGRSARPGAEGSEAQLGFA